MNSDTRHIVQSILDVPDDERHLYTPLTHDAASAAERVLDGRREAYLGRKARNDDERTLLTFARKDREKRRRRAKIAKASRRRNRR